MEAVIINLKRQPERRRYAIDECRRANIHPSIMDATDLRDLSEEWLQDNASEIIIQNLKNDAYHSMNFGALACADSHRRAWKEVRGRRIYPTLILEDDFIWLKSQGRVKAIIQSIAETDFDMVILGYSPRKPFLLDKSKGISVSNDFVVLPYSQIQRTSGSFAYLIGRKATEKLIAAQGMVIDREADDFAWEHQRQGNQLRIGFIFPPLVHHGLFDSSIWGTSNSWRSWFKRKVNMACLRSSLLRRIFSWLMAQRLRRRYVL